MSASKGPVRLTLKLSGLPHHKTIDEFRLASHPHLDAPKVRGPAALRSVEARAKGPPRSTRVAKARLRAGLVIADFQAGFSIYFTVLDDMVRNPT